MATKVPTKGQENTPPSAEEMAYNTDFRKAIRLANAILQKKARQILENMNIITL